MNDAVYEVTLNLPHDVYLTVSVEAVLFAIRDVLSESAHTRLDEGGIVCGFGDRRIRVTGTPFVLTFTLHGWPRHEEAQTIEALVEALEVQSDNPLDWRATDGKNVPEVDPVDRRDSN